MADPSAVQASAVAAASDASSLPDLMPPPKLIPRKRKRQQQPEFPLRELVTFADQKMKKFRPGPAGEPSLRQLIHGWR